MSPPSDPSRRKTKTLMCGSNIFEQLHPDPEAHFRSELFGPHANALAIIAMATYQTLYLDDNYNHCATGESYWLLEDAYEMLHGNRPFDRDRDADELVFVGQDLITALIDAEGRRCVFVRYDEDRVVLVEGSGWKTACADGRGRVMAVDRGGEVYLFESGEAFQAATGEEEGAVETRAQRRFSAHPYGPGAETSGGATLPKFESVSAGNAHFVLLAQTSLKGERERHPRVWTFGDARFGAVPLEPFEHTTVLGKLLRTSESDPTDTPHLLPIPHFDALQGFPSRIAQVSAGSRHTLVLTTDGDVYGWGWNEHAVLLPFKPGQPSWQGNAIAEPTLIPIFAPDGEEIEVDIVKIVGGNNRSFGITSDGKLAVAGSTEFCCLALDGGEIGGMTLKPRFERELSQIKSGFECVNGFQLHPFLGTDAGSIPFYGWEFGEKVLDVHASALGTFVTVEDNG